MKSPKLLQVASIEDLHSCFIYEPCTGILRRKIASGTAKPGDVAGSLMPNGYLNVSVMGRKFLVHRVVFAMFHGRWPAGDVDHINGIRSDNRAENIREASRSENMRNTKAHADGFTGIKGVHYYKSRGNYTAQICVNGQQIRLGYFSTAEEAKAAYNKAASRYHGEFVREGS